MRLTTSELVAVTAAQATELAHSPIRNLNSAELYRVARNILARLPAGRDASSSHPVAVFRNERLYLERRLGEAEGRLRETAERLRPLEAVRDAVATEVVSALQPIIDETGMERVRDMLGEIRRIEMVANRDGWIPPQATRQLQALRDHLTPRKKGERRFVGRDFVGLHMREQRDAARGQIKDLVAWDALDIGHRFYNEDMTWRSLRPQFDALRALVDDLGLKLKVVRDFLADARTRGG